MSKMRRSSSCGFGEASQGDGFPAVAGVPDNLNIRFGVQEHPKSSAHHRLVVGEQHADRHGARDCVVIGSEARSGTPGPSSRAAAVSSPPCTATRSRTRELNRLTPTRAQTVITAAILRHLDAITTTGRSWDADIASHGTRPPTATAIAA
jgi:hypothetical protein